DIPDMQDIPDKLKERELELDTIEKCIESSVGEVQKCLTQFLSVRANIESEDGDPTLPIYHSDFQIMSLITKVFKTKYSSDLKESPDWSSSKKVLLPTLPFHYLFDIIREYWRGSGNTKLRELVKNNSDYDKPIKRKDWDYELDNWFKRQKGKAETSRI